MSSVNRLVYDPELLRLAEPEDIFYGALDLIEEAGFQPNSFTNPRNQGGGYGYTLFGALAQYYFGYPDLPVSVQLGFQPVPDRWADTIHVLKEYLSSLEGEESADDWHSLLVTETVLGHLSLLAQRARTDDEDDDDSWEDEDD